MDKTETIETVTKGDINDLKAYANAIGVKCENCVFSKQSYSGSFCIKLSTLIYEKSYFCADFEKKETND